MDTAHIYIYGVIDFWQDENASDWGYVNLKSVKNQYDSQKDAKDITVHIHSEGGVVTEGFAIHDYLRSLGKPVKTVIEGTCASIATVIALAGDTRVMTTNANFFIHNPWGIAGGDKSEIQKYADELEKMESQIAEFYASKTNLKKEEALELMKNETTFTAEQAMEKGFITEIASVMRAVALLKTSNKKDMSDKGITKEEAKSMFDQFAEKMKNLLKGKAKNLLLQDAEGTEIDFPEIEQGQTPDVGDKATIDGSPAEGEYTMPNGDKFVFAGGVVESITPMEEEESEEMAALKADNEAKDLEIQNLKTELETAKTENTETLNKVKALEKDFDKLKNLAGEFEFDDKKKDGRKKNETKKRTL